MFFKSISSSVIGDFKVNYLDTKTFEGCCDYMIIGNTIRLTSLGIPSRFLTFSHFSFCYSMFGGVQRSSKVTRDQIVM